MACSTFQNCYQTWLICRITMFSVRSDTMIYGQARLNLLTGATVQALEATENRLAYFLERFPEYRKTLRLALTHEESGREARSYQGWQWHDVETHPTKLIRLVTEGISRISLRTRQATQYLLRDRDAVKRVLARS
jgi:hypothetical protein